MPVLMSTVTFCVGARCAAERSAESRASAGREGLGVLGSPQVAHHGRANGPRECDPEAARARRSARHARTPAAPPCEGASTRTPFPYAREPTEAVMTISQTASDPSADVLRTRPRAARRDLPSALDRRRRCHREGGLGRPDDPVEPALVAVRRHGVPGQPHPPRHPGREGLPVHRRHRRAGRPRGHRDPRQERAGPRGRVRRGRHQGRDHHQRRASRRSGPRAWSSSARCSRRPAGTASGSSAPTASAS